MAMKCRTCRRSIEKRGYARCKSCRLKNPGLIQRPKVNPASRVRLAPAPPSKSTTRAAGTPDRGSWWLGLDRRTLEQEAYRRFPHATPPDRMRIPLAGNGMVDA